jgi:thiol:disulfide interchange protein
MIRALAISLALSLGLAAFPVAALEAAESPASPVAVALVPKSEGIVRGKTAEIAVHVQIQEGWHVYWLNPGESGFPTRIEWELPEGVTLLSETWSAPQRLQENGQVCFGYSDDFIVLAKLLIPTTLKEGPLSVGAKVSWLSCKDSCVPGDDTPVLQLDLLPRKGATSAEWRALMARHAATLPRGEIVASVEQGTLLVDIHTAKEATDVYFFPEKEGIVDSAVAQEVHAAGSTNRLEVPLKSQAVKDVKGVVVLKSKADGHLRAYRVDTSMQTAGVALPSQTASAQKLLLTLVFAFVGGLILNLMPCVLPVISLKVFQFMHLAGSSRQHALRHGLVFTFGVVISFWVLAAVLLGLRAYGQSIGWGFQLQEPAFVILLALLLFLLGLSLLGVFELGTSLVALGGRTQQQSGYTSSFFSGVLATVVATPCTGPLLAPALGFAVTLPVAVSMVVFTVLALGMASPYLLLSAFPQALRWLPKPGAWMVVFKQLMGFFMLATTLWLLWVFSAQVEAQFALVWILAALLVVGLAAWIYGRFGTVAQAKGVRWTARLAAVALLVMGGVVALEQAKAQPPAAATQHRGGWLSWNPAELDRLRTEGKFVFVDFTAKWCLICQTNKVPMHSHEVAAVFQEHQVVKMEADWTRRDPTITAELEKFGRNGVPLYVLYGPHQEPIILPQLLTPDALIKAVHCAAERRDAALAKLQASSL